QAARIVGIGGSGRGREVDAEGVDSGPGQSVQALAEAAVGGGDEQLRTGAGRGQGRIRPAGRFGEFVIVRSGDVGDQRRFVELHPFDTGRGQDADDIEVDVGELGEPVEGTRGRARCALGQGEQGQRSDEYGTDEVTCGFGLADQRQQMLGVRGERRVIGEFGYEVVVVRVEPLRHLQGRALRGAAGEGEVLVEVEIGAGRDRGDETDRERGVEDVVVMAVGGRDRIVLAQAQLRQAVIRADAQRVYGPGEVLGVDAAGPEALQGLLLFAAGPDARVAGDGRGRKWCGHERVSFSVVVSVSDDGGQRRGGGGGGNEDTDTPRSSRAVSRSSVVFWSLKV